MTNPSGSVTATRIGGESKAGRTAVQSATVTCANTGIEVRPALSVRSSRRSYPPATSGTNDGVAAPGLSSAARLPEGTDSVQRRDGAPVARQFRLLAFTACAAMAVPTVPPGGVPEVPALKEIPSAAGPASPHRSTVTVATAGWEDRPVTSVATT